MRIGLGGITGTGILSIGRGVSGGGGGGVQPTPWPAALRNSLVAFWPLDEASGTRADSIGDNDLTDNNTVGSDTGLVYDLAAEFVAANSEQLTRAHGESISVPDASLAWWSGWFRPALAGPIETIIAKGPLAGQGPNYAVFCRNNGRLEFRRAQGDTPRTVVLNDAVTADVWHFFAAWTDGTAIYLQANDGEPLSLSSTDEPPNISPLRIGAADDGYYFSGRVGPVMFGRGYVPTAEDIAWLYNNAAGRRLT